MSKQLTNSGLVSKTDDELKKELFSLKKSLFNLRFRVAAKDVVDFSQFKKNRKSVARINTEISRRLIIGGLDA